MWQRVKLSDVSLGTGPRDSLIADEGVKKSPFILKTERLRRANEMSNIDEEEDESLFVPEGNLSWTAFLLLLLRSSCSCLSDSETRCHNVVHCQGKFFCCAIEFLLHRSVVWPRSGS